MNGDMLILAIPLIILIAGFFATDAGKTVLVAFHTSLPRGGGIVLMLAVIAAFVFTAAFYYIMIIGLLVWAMSLMGGMGNGGGNSGNDNSNSWRNTGGGE